MNPRSRKLVVGNWKMNDSRAVAEQLLPEIVANTRSAHAEVAVCVLFPLLETAGRVLNGTNTLLGAQDVSDRDKGAFTGQVSGSMLKDFGCRYVIVGHSERRSLLQEADDLVARKAQAALQHGLTPICCVGETLQEYEAGRTRDVVLRQLEAILGLMGIERLSQCVMAYEPVWAIGTGLSATPEQAQGVHAAIRERVSRESPDVGADLRIVYGGSVGPANARGLFAMSDVDGALVGGASLIAKNFAAITSAAG